MDKDIVRLYHIYMKLFRWMKWDLKDMNLSKLWETEEPGVLQSMGWQRVIQDLANEQQHGDTPSGN